MLLYPTVRVFPILVPVIPAVRMLLITKVFEGLLEFVKFHVHSVLVLFPGVNSKTLILLS